MSDPRREIARVLGWSLPGATVDATGQPRHDPLANAVMEVLVPLPGSVVLTHHPDGTYTTQPVEHDGWLGPYGGRHEAGQEDHMPPRLQAVVRKVWRESGGSLAGGGGVDTWEDTDGVRSAD